MRTTPAPDEQSTMHFQGLTSLVNLILSRYTFLLHKPTFSTKVPVTCKDGKGLMIQRLPLVPCVLWEHHHVMTDGYVCN